MVSALVFVATLTTAHGQAKLPIQMLPRAIRGGSLARDFFEDQSVDFMNSVSNMLDVPLDHFDASNNGSFKLRYYTDSSYFNSDSGPIFISMGCEGPQSQVRYNPQVQANGALNVAYEHRYYGQSLPVGGLTDENMPFLTVEQNLADAAHLVDTLRQQVGDANRAVFTFGGSYCGATCAWFRSKYPDKTTGCISESGVVNAIFDMTTFDSHIYKALHRYQPNCASALQDSTRAMERLFEQGRKDYVTSAFRASGYNGAATGDADFWYMIADQSAMMVQYGAKVALCKGLAELPSEPTDEERIQNLNSILVKNYGHHFADECFYKSDKIKNGECDMRSWRWQKCLELAYLQPAPAEQSIRATNLTLDDLVFQCQYMFPFGPSKPGAEEFNKRFGGAAPAFNGVPASNIVFLDYSDDPWLEASPMQENPGMPYCLTTCDGCGHCGAGAPASKKQHCQDVAGQYIKQWLGTSQISV